MICQQCAAVISSITPVLLHLMSSVFRRVFMYDTYVKYGSVIKRLRRIRHKFHDEKVPAVKEFKIW
jgi:hypothetical protein